MLSRFRRLCDGIATMRSSRSLCAVSLWARPCGGGDPAPRPRSSGPWRRRPSCWRLLCRSSLRCASAMSGLDVVAALSMSAALAFGEPLAGNVVALMYASGQLLERFAQGRAKREMSALLGRVARTAMRFRDDTLEEVPIASIPGGRSPPHPAGRGAAGRRSRGGGLGCPRHGGSDRRIPAHKRGWRGRGSERRHIRGRALRPRREPPGFREHLCRASCA